MKIFVKQLQTSLDLNTEIFHLVTDHIKAAKNLVIPINDHRAKLLLNAQYTTATASEFWDFYRIFNAYSIIVGAMALVSEKIYRITKSTPEERTLSTEELIQTDSFKSFLNTQEFADIMNQIHTMGSTVEVADAYSELRTLSRKLSAELQSNAVEQNVSIALNLSDLACKLATTPFRIKNQWNERYLAFLINETNEKIIMHFHGSDEEYELLDNWLSTPELKLPLVEGENTWAIESKVEFIKWFNLLRSRLESECSYQTILIMLSDLQESQKQKYIDAIQEKISVISAANGSHVLDNRVKVIAYLHQLLNNRKGFPVKRYTDFTMEHLTANWNSSKSLYVLSLYQ